jgi:hypothetical protein
MTRRFQSVSHQVNLQHHAVRSDPRAGGGLAGLLPARRRLDAAAHVEIESKFEISFSFSRFNAQYQKRSTWISSVQLAPPYLTLGGEHFRRGVIAQNGANICVVEVDRNL